ncbi:MAG: ABC transporter permease, partial [Acidobacteria bacterium]|nr:ABC transporter permease [Acidobacteriota bacterium]
MARILSSAYRDRQSAYAFLIDALADTTARGLRGAGRVVITCLIDIVRTARRPGGWPVTGAATPRTPRPDRSRVMDQLFQDVRYGVRQLRRQPGFALAAILTMALGIGANVAIFNVAWQVLLKPLPYPHSETLVEVWEVLIHSNATNPSMPGKVRDLQREARSLSVVAGYTAQRGTADLTGVGEPTQLDARAVTDEYFNVFGMAPLVGRTLRAGDAVSGLQPVVISERLWRGRFGARRDIAGARIQLDGGPATVVGVMPTAFETEGGRVDVWLPFALPPDEPRLAAHYLRVVARLAPGISLEQAGADVAAVAARAAAAFPATDGQLTQRVTSLAAARRASAAGDGLWMLGLAAAAVLIMACANLAGLQLARGIARQREFGIRTALGATRRRVTTQLLTEGLIISIAGAVVGLAVAGGGLRVLADVAPPEIRVAARTPPDGMVLTVAFALAVLSAVACSLAPSLRVATNAMQWLRHRTETADRHSHVIRLGLVTGQIACATALLISAALLVTSLLRVMRVDPGFTPDGALTFDASLPARLGTYAEQRQLMDRIGAAVSTVPGVTHVCAINEVPLDPRGGMTYVPEGQTRMINSAPRTITPDCLPALGLRLRRGRPLDAYEPRRAALVSESFANRAWPGQDPLGKRVHEGLPSGALIEIVGVVADAQPTSLEAAVVPQIYEAWSASSSFTPARFIVRAAVPPATLFTPIRAAVRQADPDQTVARLRTLNDVVIGSVAGRRFMLQLLGSFSNVSLVLAVVGVYG